MRFIATENKTKKPSAAGERWMRQLGKL